VNTSPDGLNAVGVTLSVKGENDRVADYLARLSSLERATSIDEVSTTREGDGQTSSTIRLRIFSF
jgi:Tfp pilus assembly protein PilO